MASIICQYHLRTILQTRQMIRIYLLVISMFSHQIALLRSRHDCSKDHCGALSQYIMSHMEGGFKLSPVEKLLKAYQCSDEEELANELEYIADLLDSYSANKSIDRIQEVFNIAVRVAISSNSTRLAFEPALDVIRRATAHRDFYFMDAGPVSRLAVTITNPVIADPVIEALSFMRSDKAKEALTFMLESPNRAIRVMAKGGLDHREGVMDKFNRNQLPPPEMER